MVASITSFSPSAGKPREVMKSWLELQVPLQVIEPVPVTPYQLYLAHDKKYVDGVLSLQIPNGFGNISKEVASTLLWTSGAMLSAAREALNNKNVAAAPVSGFHHAGHDFGGGFCTFNGLLTTAATLLQEGLVKTVGIIDLDHHYGDGTEEIIQHHRLEDRVLHYSAGFHWYHPDQAIAFLRMLPEVMEAFSGCDLLLAQMGADPHIDDPLGGWMTTDQLVQRDQIVFSAAKKLGMPLSWALAGGYQRPIKKVIKIHNNTLIACAAVYA